ncbi:MAG TPA: hypothetical protein VHS74_17360 [Solirubrobacterales bacterium]|jgi:hypothetical protein|nr:hypothetical protein [Solirubrobacterales bacterium]
MNQDQQAEHPTTNFEDRLLGELRAVVAERAAAAAETGPSTTAPAWRHGPRIALAGAAVTAAAAVVLIVNAGGGDTPAAYAVEPRPEGMVSVEIRGLEDAKGLEEALGEVGIPASVTYLAAGLECKEPRFQRPQAPRGSTHGKVTSGIGRSGDGGGDSATVFSISRDTVGPGQTLVVTASPGPEGVGNAVAIGVAEGTVAPCEPIKAPAGALPVPSGGTEGPGTEGARGSEAGSEAGGSESRPATGVGGG